MSLPRSARRLAGPLLGALLVTAPFARSIPQDPAGATKKGDEPAQPVRDETPSDARALGFLRGVVDQRMYSLTVVGAKSIAVEAVALLQPAEGPLQRYEFAMVRDLLTSEGKVLCDGRPLGWDRPEAMKISAPFLACATTQPSLVAEDYVVKLEREGKEVRLDYVPRVANMGVHFSEWFQRDGSRLRGHRVHQETADSTPLEVGVEYELKEVGGYALVSKETTTFGPATLVTQYEYRERGGYLVLHRLTQQTPTETLTIDYEIQVSPPRQ